MSSKTYKTIETLSGSGELRKAGAHLAKVFYYLQVRMGGVARYPMLSTSVYLGMGWLFLIVAGPVWHLMPLAGLLWLLAGGIAYTVGVGFFVTEKVRYHHLIWHLFVLAGTACHFVAVLRYAG